MKKTKRNISKKTPNGRILHTKDRDIGGAHGYNKPNKKGLYRMAVVVDSNTNEELAVVKLTTSPKGKALEDYKDGKSKYRNYIYTTDRNGNPIKITPITEEYRKSGNPRFEEGKRKNDLSKKDVNQIKKDCINDQMTGNENRKKLRRLKGRK